MALRRFLIKSTTTPTPSRFPPPPPPPSAPTTTTTPTRSPPLKPPPAPFTRPLLLLTTHLIPSTPPAPFTPPHLLTSRAFSSPGENPPSPAKVLVHQFIEKMKNHVSDLPFPPAVKAALHTILKGMLFAAGERAFELLVRVFLWVKEKLLTWWKGKKKAAEDEE